jgi:hypothetical protein
MPDPKYTALNMHCKINKLPQVNEGPVQGTVRFLLKLTVSRFSTFNSVCELSRIWETEHREWGMYKLSTGGVEEASVPSCKRLLSPGWSGRTHCVLKTKDKKPESASLRAMKGQYRGAHLAFFGPNLR